MSSRLVGLVLLIAVWQPAPAFEISGNSWVEGSATFFVDITLENSGLAPSGESWNNAFERALSQWTSLTSFEFTAVDQYLDPCIDQQDGGFGDTKTGVDFSATQCGSEFGNNVLAITLSSGTCRNPQCDNGFDITGADIVFNSNESWDIYDGPYLFDVQDFERVALHELGHALGLNHELDNDAIMQPLVGDLTSLTSDDIAGANTIYGGPTEILGTISTIYGIDVLLPSQSVLNGPVDSINLNGTLQPSDPSLESSFIDLYQFTLNFDSSATVALESTDFDPFLYLIRVSSTQDPVSDFFFSDDDSGAGLDALIETSLQAGTYWVGATSVGSNAEGDYELTVATSTQSEDKSFAVYESALGVDIEVNPNPSITGELSVIDFAFEQKFLDIYEFEALNPVTLRIDMRSDTFDTTLILVRLLDDDTLDTSVLFQNDDFEFDTTNSRIEEAIPAGRYWIGATSFDTDETGDYTIETTVITP